MSTKRKYSILANDLVRRLSNMGQSMTMAEHVVVVDKYTYKFSQDQSREIVVSGLRGFKNKKESPAKRSLSAGVRKNLMEKITWYRKTSANEGIEEEKVKQSKNDGSQRRKHDQPPNY